MLYVNGRIAARGPQKGDVIHQFYDILDLTDDLTEGENLLLVRVDSYARSFAFPCPAGPPASDMSVATVFTADAVLLNPNGSEHERLCTDETWKVKIDPSLSFLTDEEIKGHTVGFNERIDFTQLPPNFFTAPNFNDGTWEPATVVYFASTIETCDIKSGRLPYVLEPRSIKPLYHEELGFLAAWRKNDASPEPNLDENGTVGMNVPANTCAEYILDSGCLNTAYPLLSMASGNLSRIRIKYAERLLRDGNVYFGPYEPGCILTGYSDYVTTGNGHSLWSPLHWRTFRFVGVSIETCDEPLEISLRFLNCHYPIFPEAEFQCSNKQLNAFWDIGIRTQQRCAHETYEDCPYYEQNQYAGDTQVQVLFTYAVSGMTCLPRQAIRAFHWSRLPEGLTQSRYPSRSTQVIPHWSLHYLYMLHDWYMYTGDIQAIRQEVLGCLGVLRWFLDRRDERGVVGKLQYWCLVDWCPEWWDAFEGVIPGAKEGPTALTNFMVIDALEKIAVLMDLLGEQATAASLNKTASELRGNMQFFWNADRAVYIDSPLYDFASQLTNAWAILIGLGDADTRAKLAETIDTDKTLCQAAYFGRFYVFEAWRKANRPDLIVKNFDIYRAMVERGSTTWPEMPVADRSECHAWSNAPTYHLLRTILGFSILEPGCRRMQVKPYLHELNRASGAFATPHGRLFMSFDRKEKAQFTLIVPDGVEVAFSYEGNDHTLLPGKHNV